MAEKLPTYREENPQIKIQNVSGDAGFDAYAQAFSQASTGAARLSESLEAQASQNALLSAQGDIDEAQKTANLAMAQNPNNAGVANSYFKNRVNEIKENTRVNIGDRSKLNYLTKKTVSDFEYNVAKTEFDVLKATRKIDAGTYWAHNFPIYQNSLNSNDGGKLAENLEKELTTFLKNQVGQGILTGHEALLYIKQMQGAQKFSKDLLEAFGNPNTTTNDILQLHGIKNYSDESGMPLPENEITNQRAKIQYNDHSFQGLKGVIFSGGQITPQEAAPLGKRAFQLGRMQRGANKANIYAYGNNPYPALVDRYDDLKSTTGRSTEEEGELGRLKNIKNQIENNSFGWITNTATGSRLNKNFRVNLASVDRNIALTSTEKDLEKRKLTHNFHSELNALYESQKVPTEYRQFYNPQYIQAINNSLFQPGQDKNAAIIELTNTPRNQLPYIASSMSTPYKAMATYLIGKGAGVFDQGFISNLTEAVADREEKLPKGTTKGEKELLSPESDKKIAQKIVSQGSSFSGYFTRTNKWQDLINYNSIFPKIQGLDQNDILVETGVRYVKERMRQMGDLTGSQIDSFVNEYSSNVVRASNIERQGATTLDLSVIPIESESDHADLDYELHRQVIERLHDSGLSYARINQKLKDEPIRFFSTPTGHIVALNNANQRIRYLKNGRPTDLFNEPYTDNLLGSARHHLERFRKTPVGKIESYFGSLFGSGKYNVRKDDIEGKIMQEKISQIPTRDRDRK